VEGMNIGGILLGYLGVLLFAVTSLAALALLIARQTRGALILFATGLLCGEVIAALATLSFLAPEFNHDGGESPLIVLTALSLLLGGIGQLVAALRSPRNYAAPLGCSAASLVLLATPCWALTLVIFSFAGCLWM
jgi:hypothetical protein